MNSFSKAAVGGLLWLTFSAVAFGDTIYFTGQPNNVENGGQFTADLASNTNQSFFTYCVDDLNYVAVGNPAGYAVNVIDLANTSEVTADTRYGITPAGSFTYAVNVYNTPTTTVAASAQDRYAMAAYLIQQYIFPIATDTLAQQTTDFEIQNAIWTLLDATGATYSNCPAGVSQSACTTGTNAEITAAQTWINGQIKNGTLASFENTVVIYSSTSIAGQSDPWRYKDGAQEMIGFTATPEPATLAMLGAGLLAIGLFGKKLKA
jgi:hypothetical protein